MKLSEMKQILDSGDIRLTKSLGQNFLHDGNQLRRIVAAAELKASDKVLEIGPGLGGLTELLLKNAGEVLAIEKDARLLEVLRKRFKPLIPSLSPSGGEGGRRPGEGASRGSRAQGAIKVRGVLSMNLPPLLPFGHPLPLGGGEGRVRGWPAGSRAQGVIKVRGILSPPGGERVASRPGKGVGGTPALVLLNDDALEFLRREPRDWSNWKLVANLPYSVASPMLVELAQSQGCPERMVVTLQLEVAQRLVAKPGGKDYGVLTLLILLRYEPRGWFKIPAGCFFPEPDVASACVALIRRPEPLLDRELAMVFTKIVKRAFSQRRKMMFKLLKEDWPEAKLDQAFANVKLSPQARAETISLEGFAELTKALDTPYSGVNE